MQGGNSGSTEGTSGKRPGRQFDADRQAVL